MPYAGALLKVPASGAPVGHLDSRETGPEPRYLRQADFAPRGLATTAVVRLHGDPGDPGDRTPFEVEDDYRRHPQPAGPEKPN